MTSKFSKSQIRSQIRVYDRATSVVFRKTHEAFGGLSNMAGGFPIRIGTVRIRTSEALYQACRFPHLPHVQKLIIEQKSPMTAKMKSKPYREESRPDWFQVRVKIMRWCLRVKLAYNLSEFGRLLLDTGDKPIVEESRKDDFWGAKAKDNNTLVGVNVLGRLLMELREAVKNENREILQLVDPPGISNFFLDDRPISVVQLGEAKTHEKTQDSQTVSTSITDARAPALQISLFEKLPSPTAAPAVVNSTRDVNDNIYDLKPYGAMKDSKVPWLREVPAHWEVERGKWLFRRMARPVRDMDEVVTCFRDGTVTLRRKRRLRGFTESLKEIGYQGIRCGDLVIHAMDAFAGAVGVADSNGKGSPVYSVCQPSSKANAHYYAYVIREMARSQWIQALAKGIRERSTDFRFADFGSQLLPLLPLPEQAAVVLYLDHVNRRISRFIRAKRRLTELLEEQKQVIIHRAVTCGLDRNVRRKYSGVGWLGEVPEHWKVIPLRRLVSFVTSGSRGWAKFYSDTGDIFLQSGNLGRSMSLNLSFVQHVQPPEGAEGQRTRIQSNDILICITGALTGNVVHVEAELPKPAYVNQHVALVRPNQGVAHSRYQAYVLHSEVGRIQFKLGEYGGTKQGLSLDDVKSALLPMPPMSEQRSICIELDKELQKLRDTVNSVERKITLLREYRTRLIADVVTGKLDVRGEAARLLVEAEEPEPSDDLYMENGERADNGLVNPLKEVKA